MSYDYDTWLFHILVQELQGLNQAWVGGWLGGGGMLSMLYH